MFGFVLFFSLLALRSPVIDMEAGPSASLVIIAFAASAVLALALSSKV